MAKYLLGCDIGTSGTKSVIINDEGIVLGSKYLEYMLYTPKAGWAEHNPEDYWKAVTFTIRESIKQARISPSDICGVGISALSPSCILVDKDLRALQYSHIWMDRRGILEAQWIKKLLGDDFVFGQSANQIDPYYATVKLLWEKNNRPELYKAAYKIQTAADYPCMKLTGRAVTDHSNASLFVPGFDIIKKQWDFSTIEKLGLDPEKFPDIYACEEIIGGVTREAAEQTGLKKGTPVVAGTVDCNAAYVANGCSSDGDWSLTMGTAGCMGVMHKTPMFTKNMITIVHPAYKESIYSTVGATVSFGSVLRYFRDNFSQFEKFSAQNMNVDIYDIMNIEAGTIPAGSDGLVVIPYFMGERTPIWDTNARALIFGMSLAHSKHHLLRAFMEGAVYALFDNYRFMVASGVEMKDRIVVCEGGAKSALWRQILADVFSVPVAYMKESKGAPFGSALVAGVGTQVFPNYSVANQWVNISDISEPNEKAHAAYMELFDIYMNLYNGVKSQYDSLALFMEKHNQINN